MLLSHLESRFFFPLDVVLIVWLLPAALLEEQNSTACPHCLWI